MPDTLQPLSKRTRRLYLAMFVFLFVVCLPFAILYASGYRLQNGLSLTQTGGVYISVAPSGASVSINGKEVGVSGFLNHSFYVDNLAPGTYAVHVALEGRYPWYKTLTVEQQIVTDASAFMVPSEPLVRKVVISSATSTAATTTAAVSRAQYDAYALAFAPTTTKKKIAADGSLVPDDTQAGQSLYLEEGAVRLTWSRSTTTIPSSLCFTPSKCEKSVIITHSKERIDRTNFFAGGVLYRVPTSGIYLAEADVRPTPLTVPIYQRPGADYRLIGGNLIVKDGAVLYEISGF